MRLRHSVTHSVAVMVSSVLASAWECVGKLLVRIEGAFTSRRTESRDSRVHAELVRRLVADFLFNSQIEASQFFTGF